MDREGNVVDVLGLMGEQGANGQPGADGTTPHIGENGNWFIGDTDTGVPARGEGGGSGGILTETDPTVFVWAKSHLPFTDAQLSAMASGAGFVVNPTNFADGKTYFRYHAGATSFTWTNPNPQTGAVKVTVLAWSQYGDKTAANAFSALNIIYGDGTTGRLSLVNGQTVTMTTDANKVLTEIRGNYDHEDWVLLDMSVLTIAADYPAPTGTVKSVNGEKPDEDGNVQIPIPEGGAGASVMVGATSDADGASGLVPAPAAGDQGKFLAGDGTWKMPESGGGSGNQYSCNEYTFTAEITADGTVSSYEFTEDADGNPLALDEVWIKQYHAADGSYNYIYINNVKVSYRHARTAGVYENIHLVRFGDAVCGFVGHTTNDDIGGMNAGIATVGFKLPFLNGEKIQKIRLRDTATFKEGDTIKIYGR